MGRYLVADIMAEFIESRNCIYGERRKYAVFMKVDFVEIVGQSLDFQ